MKHVLILIIIVFVAINNNYAQDTLKRKGTWAVTVGTGIILPGMSKGYNVSYASNDGGRSSEYDVTPVTTFQGYLEVSHFKTLNNLFFLSYGAGYKISRNEVEYQGYSENYSYNIIDYGNRLSEHHYLSTYLGIYYQYDFRKNDYFLLNGLSIRSDFVINENYRYHVKGHVISDSSEPEYFENKGNDSRWFPKHFNYFSKLSISRVSPPYTYIYYELGFGFPVGSKILLIPSIETSLWYINKLWEKDRYVFWTSLFWYDNKRFKELILRITVNFIKTYKN